MMGTYLKSACFYTVRKCKIPKPKKEGGGEQKSRKYCFSVLSSRSAGFLVSSEPRESNIRQMKISPEEINPHIPEKYLDDYGLTRISYANLAEIKDFDEQEIASAIELCSIPYDVAEKIVKELEKILPEDFTPDPKDTLSPRDARKVIHELKTLVLR